VSAVSGDRWGWTSIPLFGRGLAIARSAPGASIRVTIGDREFGPVRADAEGNASVPVIVPAGVAYAYHREERLDLKVPGSLHLHVGLGRDVAAADVEQLVPVRVFAVTAAGTPRAGAQVVAEVDRGELAPLVEIAPGELAGTWRLPPGASGEATFRASLADEPGFLARAALDGVAGPAARLTLEAERYRVTVGVAEAISLRVQVTDAAGNGVNAEPALGTSDGELSGVRAREPGAWEASLRMSAASAARPVVVTARAADLEGRVAIDVVPPPLVPAPPAAPVTPPARSVSVAPKLGMAAARGGLWFPALGAEGEVRTPLLDGRLALVLDAGWFVRDRTDEVTVGGRPLAVRGRASYVPIIASARFETPTGSRGLAWAAAGAGVVLVAADVSVGSAPARSESGVVPGLRAAIGWGFRAGRALPFAEAALAWQGDPQFEALRGSLTVVSLAFGCRYEAF
jgi:hypothetical protein